MYNTPSIDATRLIIVVTKAFNIIQIHTSSPFFLCYFNIRLYPDVHVLPLYDALSFLGIIKAIHMIPMGSESCE